MAIDFPASPATSQQFTAAGTTYQWDGVSWNIVPQMAPAMAQDIPPANPAAGQFWFKASTGVLYMWYDDGNSQQWVQIPGGGSSLVNLRTTVITASGTYTTPNGLKFLEVWVVGGGGGGGVAASSNGGQSSAAAGGGAGGVVYKLYTAASLGASVAYVVGAGGAGGASGGVEVGRAGGNSTFAGLAAGGGGGGGWTGTTAALGTPTSPGVGGTATGGDLNLPGSDGQQGMNNPHNRLGTAIQGSGGGNLFAQPRSTSLLAGVSAGLPGNAPGGGGMGSAVAGVVGAVTAGGAGAGGAIIMKEYF